MLAKCGEITMPEMARAWLVKTVHSCDVYRIFWTFLLCQIDYRSEYFEFFSTLGIFCVESAQFLLRPAAILASGCWSKTPGHCLAPGWSDKCSPIGIQESQAMSHESPNKGKMKSLYLTRGHLSRVDMLGVYSGYPTPLVIPVVKMLKPSWEAKHTWSAPQAVLATKSTKGKKAAKHRRDNLTV